MILLLLGLLQSSSCDPDNGGFKLPDGFCAKVVLQDFVGVRHIAVAPNGDLFVARRGRDAKGFYLLRDTTGDGRVDLEQLIDSTGGTGVLWTPEAVYFGADDKILRFPWKPGAAEPSGPAEVIASGLPTGGHSAKTLAVGSDGGLFVNFGSRTNSCQEQDRQKSSPGHNPCPELETRAGIWRFDPRRQNQTAADGTRWATGLRNAMSMAIQPGTGVLYSGVHGRDQLTQSWGFSDDDGAENPAEEFGPITDGADYGWPYCYYDPRNKRKVQAPEYGGDGTKVGDCDRKTQPAMAFPAHWAPMASLFYSGTLFPAQYRDGVFLAFHGSWNRGTTPDAQQGFRVVFVPFQNGRPVGTWEDFAVPAGAQNSIRPTGLALGSDGSLYISADAQGKIWRVGRK
jgi:glucose/arabinose dehydrogenase